jgi:hypothetical protein
VEICAEPKTADEPPTPAAADEEPQQLTFGPRDVTDPAKGRGTYDASRDLDAIRVKLAALPPLEATGRRRREGSG